MHCRQNKKNCWTHITLDKYVFGERRQQSFCVVKLRLDRERERIAWGASVTISPSPSRNTMETSALGASELTGVLVIGEVIEVFLHVVPLEPQLVVQRRRAVGLCGSMSCCCSFPSSPGHSASVGGGPGCGTI